MLTGNTTSSTGAPNSMLSPKISASSAFVVLWWTGRARARHEIPSAGGRYVSGRNPRLDLVPVRVAAHADVVK